MSNNQQTVSNITVAYNSTSGLQISTVTDGAGRVYAFTYSSNLLSKIAYKGTGSSEITYATFTYSSSNLTKITDKDGKASNYTYNGSGNTHLLLTATDVDGYKLSYTYGTTTVGLPSRVTNVKEYAGSTLGGELTIEYSQNQTTFTDVKGNVQIMQFNNWGNTVCIQDNEGHAQYAKYATDSSSSGKGNQLTAASKLQNTVGNILQYGSFETGGSWSNSGTGVSRSTEAAYHGSYSLKVTGSGNIYTSAVSVPAGESLTISAWVKTASGATAYLNLNDGSTSVSSSTLPASSGWTRLEANYTNTTSAAKSVTPRLYVTGTTYMDCVQLEYASTASRYNLVENGDFRYTTDWTNTESSGSTETRTTNSAVAAPELSTNVYTMTGISTVKKHVAQTVVVKGVSGDTFVFGGWAKGDALPFRNSSDANGYGTGIPGERQFGIKLSFLNGSTVVNTVTANFNPDCNSAQAWQYTAAVAVAGGTYTSVKLELMYDYNSNNVLFDGIQLYKEQFGQSYTYDSNGNVISMKDLQAQTTTYQYSNNNLTREILPTGAQLNYTYDGYHNVLTATTQQGVVYSFTYDTYGNNTSVSIGSGSSKITSSATYANSGNTLATVKDSVGNTTTYTYNSQTNVLESVQYPRDSSSTKTSYTYDSMYRVATASTPVSGLSSGTALTASYTYTNDNLTSLQTGTTTYTLAYGNFALLSSIKIGSRTLASYSYTSDRTNRLSQLSYGNGGKVTYTYDNQGRVTKETYEDGDTVTYRYDNDGALATVVDSATGRSTTYTYDFTDRLMKVVESGSGYSHSVGYANNTINNLTSLMETINETAHATTTLSRK